MLPATLPPAAGGWKRELGCTWSISGQVPSAGNRESGSRVSACSTHSHAKTGGLVLDSDFALALGWGTAHSGCRAAHSLHRCFSQSQTSQRDDLMSPFPVPTQHVALPRARLSSFAEQKWQGKNRRAERQRGARRKLSSCSWEDADESGCVDKDEKAIHALG